MKRRGEAGVFWMPSEHQKPKSCATHGEYIGHECPCCAGIRRGVGEPHELPPDPGDRIDPVTLEPDEGALYQ